jgi:hypothetical protein
MLEELPDELQDRVAERLREYIAELQDELEWDRQFASTADALGEAARRARQQIADGQARPLDPDEL